MVAAAARTFDLLAAEGGRAWEACFAVVALAAVAWAAVALAAWAAAVAAWVAAAWVAAAWAADTADIAVEAASFTD